MNNSFDFNIGSRIDPGRVRNFLRDAQNDKERKTYKPVFHIIYAVICSVLIYFAADGVGILPSLLMCTAPALCVFTFLYSPAYVKAIPVALPIVLFVIRSAVTGFGDNFYSVAAVLFVLCLCLLSAAVMTKSVISGYTKNSVMISLSVTYGLVLLCQIAFLFISLKGSFSARMLVDYIDEFLGMIANRSIEIASSDDYYNILGSVMLPEQLPSKQELIKTVSDYIYTACNVVKMCIPAIFAIMCMFYGFVSVAVFSLVAKIFRINIFVSIMDKFWTYRPGVITANIYDILFIAFVIGMFVPYPETVSACIVNFLLILTPVMCISGVKGIYEFFVKKVSNGFLSAFITAAILFAVSMFSGAFLFFILGSAGIFFITAKAREEKMLFPEKFTADKELYIKLYGNGSKKGDN